MLVTKNKLFSQIVHSNTVHTPKHGVSELYDPEWMSIEELLSDRHIRCWSGISSQDINLSFKSKNIICSGSGNIM